MSAEEVCYSIQFDGPLPAYLYLGSVIPSGYDHDGTVRVHDVVGHERVCYNTWELELVEGLVIRLLLLDDSERWEMTLFKTNMGRAPRGARLVRKRRLRL